LKHMVIPIVYGLENFMNMRAREESLT